MSFNAGQKLPKKAFSKVWNNHLALGLKVWVILYFLGSFEPIYNGFMASGAFDFGVLRFCFSTNKNEGVFSHILFQIHPVPFS